MVARTHDGGTVMVIGHEHAPSVAILREAEPGVFELGVEGSPFPMKVELEMPEPGRLRHAWWYGAPGGEAIERGRPARTHADDLKQNVCLRPSMETAATSD